MTPQIPGSVDYPSTRGNTRECRVTRHRSRKSGIVSFVRGALPKYNTCPNINHMIRIRIKKASWAYTTILIINVNQLYPIVSRVKILLLYKHILNYRVLIHVYITKPKPQPGFLLNRSLGRAVSLCAPCT